MDRDYQPGDFMEAYLPRKTLHLVGVILFPGNIIATGWWKRWPLVSQR